MKDLCQIVQEGWGKYEEYTLDQKLWSPWWLVIKNKRWKQIGSGGGGGGVLYSSLSSWSWPIV